MGMGAGAAGSVVGPDWRGDANVGCIVVIKKFLYPGISFKAAEDVVKALKAF